VITCE